MTTVRLFQNPFSGEPPQEFQTDSLALWLLDRYERGPRVSVQVFVGEPSGETDISANAEAILRCDAPAYTVLESPGDPVSIAAFVLTTVINLVIAELFAKDPKPLENRSQESPNNQLANRENRVRPMERVPEIFGTVRSIPDLMMPTYYKYINHRKVEYFYGCITRGYADVTDIRDGDTLGSEIEGFSAAVYAPFTSPNSGTPQATIGDAITDVISTVSRSSSVDSIVLKAANEIQPFSPDQYWLRGPGSATVGGAGKPDIPLSTGDVLWQVNKRPDIAAVAEVGQTIHIVMSNTDVSRKAVATTASYNSATKTYTVSVSDFFRGVKDGTSITIVGGFLDAANVGTKTVVSHTANTVTVAEAGGADETNSTADTTFGVKVNYTGARTIAEVQSGYLVLSGSAQFPHSFTEFAVISLTVDNGLSDWTGWFTLPQTDRTEVWANVLAPNGMVKDDGSDKAGTTVEFEMEVEQLDSTLTPTGTVETVSGSIFGATSIERAVTVEHTTAWTGPARVRMRRTTDFDYGFNGLVADEIRWMDLYSVSPVTKLHFGNKTTIHTVTRSTTASTALRRRELNCLASRKLPTFNGTTFSGAFDAYGALASGTISATSRIVDIIAAVAADPKIGALDVDEDVDMAQLWAVQQALDAWNTECGQFNYTFDKDSISFEETLIAIADAAFCVPYRQNGKIRLALDRPQSTSVALFTHRNKKPDAEVITRKFASDSDYDGVELVYTDPETEDQETIRLPLDGSYTKLKKVEISGIRSYEQAWFRANREYNRLRYQRLSIETEVTTDARALLPNSRVLIVDNTRFKSYDGEVVGQSGLTLTLSRDVEFLPATPHSIVLTKRDGSIQSIACTAGSAANEVVLGSAPAEAIVTTPTNDGGNRTSFSFAADSARAAQAWLVQEIEPTEGQYMRLRAINYSDSYYTADSEAVPAKEGVIN